MRDFDAHPGEDVLEAYSLRRLNRRLLARVEEHLLACEACRRRLEEAAGFAEATRVAARRLRDVPLDFTHDTEDGPIRLRAEKTRRGKWLATFSGQLLQGADRFKTVREANEFLLESFRRMFPEHECSDRCRPAQP